MKQSKTQSIDTETGFVDDYLLYLLAAASEAASAQFHAQVRQAGLRVPEWRVLACLYDNDGAMITQLARIALAEQSRLTRIIIQMEERGLVSRKGDPNDGRRVRVYLSDEGRSLVSSLVPDARRHETYLLAQLNDSDGRHLKTALHSLLEALEVKRDGKN
ncbi:MarR family winged helix-turn-helix transcriptional regulator [Lentibacter sp. XHP0401]|uniref:MarR family winged helix-turn-helix transcriptional regulator n=1 Tax=Lentibacter sp. XHP0401 TaxID=2984334 RepID=UPI0021E73BB5|nr:MarR family winged helix-turn-helix transcriptional regulator [Lentibacter sp. XHP0401]MCV2893155.1 MarR family winged helix-turn-helix transcriptional regulator [Lentibacter sp. XHP0401]